MFRDNDDVRERMLKCTVREGSKCALLIRGVRNEGEENMMKLRVVLGLAADIGAAELLADRIIIVIVGNNDETIGESSKAN
jgi:hypothetical protein